jgi:OFA family oxalate/formate antiporter-like MFS transporter
MHRSAETERTREKGCQNMVGPKETAELQEKPFRAYLPIVISIMLTVFVAGGFGGTGGLFMPVLAQHYGVHVSDISIYMTIGGFVMAVAGPLLGRAFVKFPIKVGGVVLLLIQTVTYIAFAVSLDVTGIVVAGTFQYAFGMLIVSMYVPTVVNRWFKDRAGTILGLSAAMTGAGGALWLLVAQAVIDSFGYQSAYWLFAVLCAVCIPLVLYVGNKPSDKGMLSYVDAKSVAEASSAQEAVEKKNWSVDPNRAVKSASFWFLVLFIVCCQGGVKVANFFPTYVNSLSDAGVAVFISGALLASLVMVGQAIFKVVIGMSSDITSPKKAMFIGAGAGIVAVLLIWLCATTPLLPVGGLIFGLYYACPAVLMPLVAGYAFGTGPNFSVTWGRALLPSGILMAPFTSIWPLVSENFGWSAVYMGVIACICLFVAFGTLSMKTSKGLPHETISVGGNLEDNIENAEKAGAAAESPASSKTQSAYAQGQ